MSSTTFTTGTLIEADWLNDVNTAVYDSEGSNYVAYTPAGTGAVPTTIQTKLREDISPQDFGAVGNNLADDTAALQAAFDHAGTLAVDGYNMVVVDLKGLTYSVTEPLVLTAAHEGITIQNGSIIASSTFTTSSDPVIHIDGSAALAVKIKLKNLLIDAGRYAQGILLENTSLILIDECEVVHFDTYGIKAITKGTELRIRSTTVNEFLYGETGYNLAASRTAKAFWIETADFTLIDCVSAYSGYCFYKTAAGGGQIIGCHFYSPSADATEPYGVYCTDPGERALEFIDCHFDNCIFGLVDTFYVSIIGCSFFRSPNGNNTKVIELITTTASNTCDGLSVIGCKFIPVNGATFFTTDDNFITFTTDGGSFSTTLNINWINAMTEDGVVPKWLLKAGKEVVVSASSVELVDGSVSLVPQRYTFGIGTQTEHIVIDGGAAKSRLTFAQTAGLSRWAWGANETAEGGSEAGSDWVLHSYDDAGDYAFSPMIVYRATGMLQLNNNVVMKPGGTAPVLGTNGQVTFELTNNTTLTFKARGSDGTTRSGTVTLSP